MENQLNPEAIAMLNAMTDAVKGKDKKKKAEKGKIAMIVDGKVMSKLIPSKKEAKAAARTIALKAIATTGKEPKIAIAEVTSLYTIDVPVASEDTDGITSK